MWQLLTVLTTALKAGLLETNERATVEIEKRDRENRDSVAPREMETICSEEILSSSSSSLLPPPPLPLPPTSTTTLRVSVDAAVKMEEVRKLILG